MSYKFVPPNLERKSLYKSFIREILCKFYKGEWVFFEVPDENPKIVLQKKSWKKSGGKIMEFL